MQGLLAPELLLTRLHIRNVASQPVVEFHLQFRFERLRLNSRTHPSDQVQEVAVRSFQPRRVSIDQWLRRQWQPKVRHAPARQLGPIKTRRRHTDYRKRMPVNLISSSGHRWVRGVLFLPDVVAHYRDGWRTLLVVRVGHQPADPRLHAKGPEEVAGHVLTVARIRL